MEISIVELHVLEVYLSSPLFPLFIVVLMEVKVLSKNFDISEEEMIQQDKKRVRKRLCIYIYV